MTPPLNTASLYKLFFAIACLKKKPQDIPESKNHLYLAFVFFILTDIVHTSLHQSFTIVLPVAILDLALLTGFIYACLALCRFSNRWTQTVTAMAGSSSVIGLIAIPIIFILTNFDENSPIFLIASGIIYILLIWNIIVYAHIFRHAFSILFVGGIAIAVLYFILLNTCIVIFIPEYFSQ